MTESPEENKNSKTFENAEDPIGQHDLGYKFLSDAFGVSFVVLKGIMILVVILFVASGFKTVSSDEQAIVLRFGKIRGAGEERILNPGLHWILPYPIEEIVKIPVAKNINLATNSFWYAEAIKRPPESLNPIYEGYCITRSEPQGQLISNSAGSDYNIVHSKWQVIYKIEDPERFFRNAYIDKVKPGQNFADIITESISPLLKQLVDSSIVSTMVYYTIDESLISQDRIPKHVRRLLQQKLDRLEIGIKAISVQLTDITWPRQVNFSFDASIKAGQTSQKTVTEAKSYAENTLSEAAGPAAEEFLKAVKDGSPNEVKMELLWQQLAGQSQEQISLAKAYRTEVVESAKANADYLQKILPQYRKRPELIIQRIYQDAIEEVLGNTDEKMIIQPTESSKPVEIRMQINRDPLIKSRSEQGGEK